MDKSIDAKKKVHTMIYICSDNKNNVYKFVVILITVTTTTTATTIQPLAIPTKAGILSRVRMTLDGVLDWRLDLLTTLTHDS
jgi:hypothetical protein